MKKIFLFISVVALLLLSGCGYKDGVSTEAQKSYLYFTGNTSNVVVSIDNGSKFNVKNGKNNHYAIAPGKHLVEAYRENTLILKQEVFVSDGVSKEIEIK
ncbi:MAG: hypothetical protein RBR59_10210 [Sulfurimonadaceae bacterium]|jgi:outer membrane lipoprotein-sorting protein|nr:hypothetical protein [Sulfurimonadaceae bacterium]